mmetsp:Transcript_51508/g.112940  ORF Transcript_51508/g.112940 Transcript_51508/m.112940 type:complete len:205 (-) Transcript_51508:796-1410(-)
MCFFFRRPWAFITASGLFIFFSLAFCSAVCSAPPAPEPSAMDACRTTIPICLMQRYAKRNDTAPFKRNISTIPFSMNWHAFKVRQVMFLNVVVAKILVYMSCKCLLSMCSGVSCACFSLGPRKNMTPLFRRKTYEASRTCWLPAVHQSSQNILIASFLHLGAFQAQRNMPKLPSDLAPRVSSWGSVAARITATASRKKPVPRRM